MATHDYVIANGDGATVRADINGALAAIVSNNSSGSDPSTVYAYMWYYDTGDNILKMRNAANNNWINLAIIYARKVILQTLLKYQLLKHLVRLKEQV